MEKRGRGRPAKSLDNKIDKRFQFLFDRETVNEMRTLMDKGFNFQPFVRSFVKRLIDQQKTQDLYRVEE